eukprot:scaffold4396_cov204-Amphora_coffeaeformis.AAC.7
MKRLFVCTSLLLLLLFACFVTTTEGLVTPSSVVGLQQPPSTRHHHHHQQQQQQQQQQQVSKSHNRRQGSLRRLSESSDDDGDDDDYSTLETVTTRGGGVLPSSRRGVDLGAVAKYVVGIGTQVTLIMGLFKAMDAGVARLSFPIPFWANVVFFYALHTKTGTFNPLSQRSQPKDQKFVRPRWTPPGWVFAVMWPLFVFGIRAVTAAMMVAAAGGRYAIPTLLWLHLHLSFGNLWNSINRVDQRLGASVPALYGLLVTNLVASYRFYLVRPIAGKLLAATSIWLAAAAVLETHAWLINPDPTTGQPEPLYPAKDTKWKTKFRWEA